MKIAFLQGLHNAVGSRVLESFLHTAPFLVGRRKMTYLAVLRMVVRHLDRSWTRIEARRRKAAYSNVLRMEVEHLNRSWTRIETLRRKAAYLAVHRMVVGRSNRS